MSSHSTPRLSSIRKAINPELSSSGLIRATSPNLNQPELLPSVTEIPGRLRHLEPREPFHIINDDPVFDVFDAARILGISQDLLEKWRQRGQGPDYIQYLGTGGPVRYELSALEAFKESYRVVPVQRPLQRG